MATGHHSRDLGKGILTIFDQIELAAFSQVTEVGTVMV